MTPNTTIKFLHNVPLDRSYRHTLYFASADAQASYFMSMEKSLENAPYSAYMYRRWNDPLYVRGSIDDFYDVNYMMFQNANYGDKWFYAFVTAAEYENINTVKITFELDIMQTWFFDHELKPSYVERCHKPTDIIGENLVPENIDIGDPVVLNSVSTNTNLFKNWGIFALSSFSWSTWQPAAGDTVGGVFNALARSQIGEISLEMVGDTLTFSYITDPRPKLIDLMTNHAALVDGLAAIFMAPMALEQSSPSVVRIDCPNYGDRLKPLNRSNVQWYIPRNNKLYTWPFTKLFVTDGSGGGKFFAFEKWGGGGGGEATFGVFTDRAAAQSVVCAPAGYNGYKAYTGFSRNEFNFEESVIMTGFPQCAWISNSYQTYLAQNASTLGLSSAFSAAKIVVGGAAVIAGVTGALPTAGASLAATSGGIGIIGGGIKDILALNADKEDRASKAPVVHGQVTGTAMFGIAEKAFRFVTYCPTYEYCRIIDNFFDMYGYAQHEVFVPIKNARPHWTYIKTVGALVLSAGNTRGINAETLRALETIYNNGVTFWVNPAKVGDYSLDNSGTH